MKHLFIINPAAGKVKGKVDMLKKQVRDFFRSHPDIPYDLYVTEWCRDAVGYTRGYIMDMYNAGNYDSLRVHVMGGPGTLYEIVNAVIGIPDLSVAAYPLGTNYHFLRYYAPEKSGLFASLEKQVFSRTIPIDVFRCGHNLGVNSSYIGLEARADMIGDNMVERGWPSDFSYALSALYSIFGDKDPAQYYSMELDGQCMDGEYISIGIANGPCYGNYYCPAPHAHPDDGLLDIYLVHKMPKWKIVMYLKYYLSGRHDEAPPGLVSHYRGRKLTISSESSINMCIDGENFAGTSFEYEIMHHAINFVCPDEIDLGAIPLIFNRPKEGLRNDR